MDRNREARRATIVGYGFNRRRHRTNSLRDSTDEDGGMELQESARLRDRVKKDRDRERERERERDLRERSDRSKRRRAERSTTNRDDIGGDESSDESVNDDEDEEDDESAGRTGVRLVSAAVGSIPNHLHGGGGPLTNHHHSRSSGFGTQGQNNSHHHLQPGKTCPPGSSAPKVFRSPPAWKSGDEMIGVSVPRKARTASTKRSNDWISSSSNNNSGGAVSGREQTLRQESSSPARHGPFPLVSAAPVSPSSNSSTGKKLKPSSNFAGGPKPKPPKASPKLNSSNPEELEIEIAEVLYGLMTQSHGPSSKKEDAREANRSSLDAKSMNSSPISNSSNLSYPSLGPNSSPLSAIAPKRKRPRQVSDSSGYVSRGCPVSAKMEDDQPLKPEVSSSSAEKIPVEDGYGGGAKIETNEPENLKERRDFASKVEVCSEKESAVAREDESDLKDLQSTTTGTASSVAPAVKLSLAPSEKGNLMDAKFEIDLMAPPPQMRSSPEREAPVGSLAAAVNPKLVLATDAAILKDVEAVEEGPMEEEAENKGRIIDLQVDLEKLEREGNGVRSKSLQNSTPKQTQMQFKATREETPSEKPGPSAGAMPLALSMVGWPGGLPPMGYVAPLQGMVPMDGSSAAPNHLQPLSSQPRPKRCATHCHIARNILFFQQVMKMSPFWAGGSPGAASLFGSKSSNVNAADLQGSLSLRGPPGGGKEKSSQPATTASADSRKQQQILIQQTMPPVAAGSLLGPAFLFPVNQQPPAAAGARPGSGGGAATNASSASTSSGVAAAPPTMAFNYPNMSANESQYLAILPNNGYPFPVPAVGAPPGYRGAPPLFNGSYYSSQMILPPQLHQQQQQQQQSSASASNSSSVSQKLQPRPQNGMNLHSQIAGEDARGGAVNVYSQNMGLPFQPQNFALMAASPAPAAGNRNSQTEKKAHQTQPGLKESLPPSFAMSFDAAQSHAVFQSSQMVAKAGGVDSSDDKKLRASKVPGVDIGFNRSDMPDSSAATQLPVINVVESSSRTVMSSGGNRISSCPSTSNAIAGISISNDAIQTQIQQQLQEHQKLISTPISRSKVPATSNGGACSEHLSSSPAKFPSPAAGFPQNLVGSSAGSPNQSPQWKSSPRTATISQAPPLTTATLKNHQLAPVHTQISFGGNQQKPLQNSNQTLTPSERMAVYATRNANQKPLSPSERMVVYATRKIGQNSSSLSAQPPKNSPSITTQKPASVLGKNQTQQQQPQPKSMHQAQLFFSNPYTQSQSPHSASTSSSAGGYFAPKRRPEHNQQPPPATSAATSTSDPANAIAAAAADMKSRGMPPQFAAQPAGSALPAGYSYIHPVPAAVQVKPAEQKQPAG